MDDQELSVSLDNAERRSKLPEEREPTIENEASARDNPEQAALEFIENSPQDKSLAGKTVVGLPCNVSFRVVNREIQSPRPFGCAQAKVSRRDREKDGVPDPSGTCFPSFARTEVPLVCRILHLDQRRNREENSCGCRDPHSMLPPRLTTFSQD